MDLSYKHGKPRSLVHYLLYNTAWIISYESKCLQSTVLNMLTFDRPCRGKAGWGEGGREGEGGIHDVAPQLFQVEVLLPG